MPPSQRSGGKSADDQSSGGRLSGASGASTSRYIDIDIDSDMAASKVEKRSHSTRSDGRPPSNGSGGKLGNARGGSASELSINLQIEVGDRSFYFHKFPFRSRSSKLNRLVFESRNAETGRISLPDIPGGSQAFEWVARFLYVEKLDFTPLNVAAIRCAAEYLEMTDKLGDNNLVAKADQYLNCHVVNCWRDCITVLKSCSDLTPWADDLEIVRRCTDSIAYKCSNDPPHGMRWTGSPSASIKSRDWWFHDVCSLNIDLFSKVIHSVSGSKGQSLIPSALGYYAEKWLQLTKDSDMSTTLKLTKSEESSESPVASLVAFTGFNQDIVAKDATQAQHKNRAILQGIVKLLPLQLDSLSVKFLFKLLRVACLVNAGTLCKTDLAKRIGSQLEKVSLDDLLISTYDVDIVQQIVEFYIQNQSYENFAPFSPRTSSVTSGSSLSGATIRSSSSLSSSSLRSLSSATSSDLSLSGSSSGVTTESSSRSGRSVSGSSDSGSGSGSSVRSSDTGSSNSRSSSNLSSRSGSSSSNTGSSISRSSSNLSSRSDSSSSSGSSFTSTSNSDTGSSDSGSDTGSGSSTSSSASSVSLISTDESVKLEMKSFYPLTESPRNRRSQLPPTTANFKVAQLLETYLEEIAKDSSISLEKFITLADLFSEFPRDSDDAVYRAIDGFLRAHPSLTEMERKKLCCVMDPAALSLAASVHAASNERLPLRIIVQLLVSEQIKLRNEMAGNDLINEKDLGDHLPSFSSSTTTTTTTTTSSSESSSDRTTTSSSSSSTGSSSTSGSGSSTSLLRSPSISSASDLNLVIARSPSIASMVSSQLLGGLSVKETLRFVLAEIESLRTSVQEIEAVKSRLTFMDTLHLEMQKLSSKFHEMSHDYIGMTQQMEELMKSSKNVSKSGWGSGWKKVTKSFQSKDNQEQVKIETPPLAPVIKPLQTPDVIATLPTLKTVKSETLQQQPKTPKADSTTLTTKDRRADSLPVTRTKSKVPDATRHPRSDSLPVTAKSTPKGSDSLPSFSAKSTPRGSDHSLPQSAKSTPRGDSSMAVPKTANLTDLCPRTPKADHLKLGALKRSDVVVGDGTLLSRESFKAAQETPTSTSKKDLAPPEHFSKDRRKEDYIISGQRSHHVEDVLHRRSVVRSRSTSPNVIIRPPLRHGHVDQVDVVSVTSTTNSSHSTSSSGHRYRGGARGSSSAHDRSTSTNGSRHHHHHHHGSSSTTSRRSSKRSSGDAHHHRRQQHPPSHEKQVGSHEELIHHGGLVSSPWQSHRQESEQHRHSTTSHHSDHLSADSHPRHSGTPSHHHSAHHRPSTAASYNSKDGSSEHHHHSSHRRKDQNYTEPSSKHSSRSDHQQSHHSSHPKHNHPNDSGINSSGSGPWRRRDRS